MKNNKATADLPAELVKYGPESAPAKKSLTFFSKLQHNPFCGSISEVSKSTPSPVASKCLPPAASHSLLRRTLLSRMARAQGRRISQDKDIRTC